MEKEPDSNSQKYTRAITNGIGKVAIEFCKSLKYLGLAPYGMCAIPLDDQPYSDEMIKNDDPRDVYEKKLDTFDIVLLKKIKDFDSYDLEDAFNRKGLFKIN